MYRVTADREATFEEKVRRLIDLGRKHLGLPYGVLTRIEEQDVAPRAQSEGEGLPAEPHQPASGIQRVLYASGDHPLLQAGETCPLSEAYCRETVRRTELLSIQHAPAQGWKPDPAYERFELGSYIGSRILVEGELYGTFCFASREVRDRPFSDDEEALVELLTRWASYELGRQRSRERIEQFAELVTHDLRNPLNAAQMHLHMARHLLDRAPPEGKKAPEDVGGVGTGDAREEESPAAKVHRHLGVSERALGRMEAIITDTLALAHGEQRLGPSDLEPVRLAAAVEASWEQAGGGALLRVDDRLSGPGASGDPSAEKGASKEGFFLLAHEGRLRQLLENLFRNAVDHAGPEVTVTVGGIEGGFFVADDGPGIPPHEREKIFEPSYSTRKGGTGLGLSIVRAVATAHGWSLSVSEGPGGGARFEITGIERPGS
ncbi:MAG: GAF domain-containing sensor histidine kinase [Salinibacter sp.]